MRTQARTTRPCRAAAGHSAAMPPPFIRRAAAPFICGGAAPFIRRAAALVILATLTVSAHAETVSIASAADWAAFAERVNAGETDLCAEMTADVTLGKDAPRVGSSNYFGGTFDGQGHTLTVAFEETNGSGSDRDPPCAPFAYVCGASIRNLHVTGTIASNGRYAAGFCGFVAALNGTTSLSNCRSSVCVECRVDGDATSAGFVGAVKTPGTLQMSDCVFDGSICSGRGVTAHSCGGFVGWRDASASVYLGRCLFAPAKTRVGTDGNTSTFVRDNNADGRNIDACHYLQALGAAQGANASATSAEDLAAALGSDWTVADGKVVLASFPDPVEVYDPDWVEISSAADWAQFAEWVNAGETYLCAKMTADVALGNDAPRVGTTEATAWTGEFDGGGHTLTVDWTFAGTKFAAPFAIVSGCFVHDLHVAGSISSDTNYVAGFAGWAKPGARHPTFERCRSSVALTCTKSGEVCCGGFVGYTYWAVYNVCFRDCLFDGSLLGPNAERCGGFAASPFVDANIDLHNCLFDPAQVTVSSSMSGTLVGTPYSSHTWVDTCYYTRVLGLKQGTDASAMSEEDLAAALGGNWIVASGKVLPKTFVEVGHPENAVAGFVYQGALRDAQGFALAEKRRTVEIRLYAQAAGGTSLWGRKHDVLLDDAGLFLVQLSDDAGTPVDGDPGTPLADVLARNAGVPLFAGVTVAGAGAEISPRQKLLPAPFALLASDASAARGDFAVAGALSAEGLVVSDELAVPSAQVSGAATAGTLGTAGGVRADGNLSVAGELAGYGTIPVGGIVAWNGAESAIPNGWALCNGQTANGRKTPDLRNRFVVAAGGQYKAGDTGGEDKHKLTVSELPPHTHTYDFKGADFDLSWDDDNYIYDASEHYKDRPQNANQRSTNAAGGDQPHENRPPYYALCYIMRVR